MGESLGDWLGLHESERSQLDYWLMLARLRAAGADLAQAVLYFGGPEGVFSASAEELSKLVGLRPATLAKLVSVEAKTDLAKERTAFVASGASLIGITSDQYPARLRDLASPPVCLFVRGRMDALQRDMVSIVGSRNAPESALRDAEGLAQRLAACGVCVVSGFAVGVDSAAHRGAIEAGSTIAVLGCGIDVNYPRDNQKMRETIQERGLLLTELPLGAEPRRWTFPVRNRAIAALGQATVVIGAREQSGALLTAQVALELGRPLGVVPGDARDARHRGGLALLSRGATLVESAEDVLELIGRSPVATPPPPATKMPPLSPDERRVWEAVPADPIALDEVVAAAGLDTRQTSTALMLLEVKGLVRRHPGGRFSREANFC